MVNPRARSTRRSRLNGSPAVAAAASLLLLLVGALAAGATLSSSSPASAAATSGVFGWGDNTSGQATGTAASTAATRPAKVSGLSTLKQVVAVEGVSFGLRSDGVVLSWGDTSDARLGRTSPVPAPVPGWTGVTSISHSHGKVLAQRSSGPTLCAGPACTATDFSVPNYRPEMGQVREMAFSMKYVLFMRTGDGSVWGTGPRSQVAPGQSGDQYQEVTAKIAGFKGITSISSGYEKLTALDSSGRVWSWGDVPGDGTNASVNRAVLVPGLSDVVQVDMADISGAYRYALTRSGSVYEWGGVGTASASNRVILTPQRMTSLPTVKKIIVKRSMAYALTTAGEVWQWDPDSSSSVPTPVKVSGVSGGTDFTAFGADGWNFELTAYALRSDGTVVSWGSGESGQLGDGSSSDRTSAAVVPGLTGLKGLDGDGSTVVAIGTFDPSVTSPTTAPPTSSPTSTNTWASDPCYKGLRSVDKNWRFAWQVSEDDGVVLTGASLNGRKAVRAMQVPRLVVKVTVDGVAKDYPVELQPVSKTVSGAANANLTALVCDARRVYGTYKITGLPAGLVMHVEQGYTFADVDGSRCEPSGRIRCARMWPSLKWKTDAIASPNRVKVEVTTLQRLDLQPDGGLAGEGMVMRDRANISSNPGVVTYSNAKEFSLPTLGSDDTTKWDNYHQSAIQVTKPGANPFMDGGITPGCADCVHIHWRWTWLAAADGTDFTSGRAAVFKASPQRAWITVVREHLDRDETDPSDPAELVNDEGLPGGHPIVLWKSTSTGMSDGSGGLWDEAFPVLSQNREGDRGGLWYSPDKPAATTSSVTTSSTSMGHH